MYKHIMLGGKDEYRAQGIIVQVIWSNSDIWSNGDIIGF